jgi:protein TonB
VVEAPPAPPSPDTTPRLISSSKPSYPISSIRAQEQGRTTLSLCVNESGRVTSADLANSSGHATLDNAALKWINNARFKPATSAGHAVAMCGYNVIYQWDLKDARS